MPPPTAQTLSPPSLLRISVPSASNQRFKTGWCWNGAALAVPLRAIRAIRGSKGWPPEEADKSVRTPLACGCPSASICEICGSAFCPSAKSVKSADRLGWGTDRTWWQSGGGPPQSKALRAVGGVPPALRELRVLRAKPAPRTPIRGVDAPAYSLCWRFAFPSQNPRQISGAPQVGFVKPRMTHAKTQRNEEALAFLAPWRETLSPSATRESHGAGAAAPYPFPFVTFVRFVVPKADRQKRRTRVSALPSMWRTATSQHA
jgi:hypothetical protein